MYCYIYDAYLQDKKYARSLARIEGRLTDLGLNGKISRLSPLKNLKSLLDTEIKRGCQTVVIVGNDNTLIQAINIIAEAEATLGFIPVGPENLIAQTLGIPEEEAACDVLSARLVAKLDLGRINGHYFLTQVEAPMDNLLVTCNNQYTIRPLSTQHYLKITNLHPLAADPQDGLLEVIIEAPKKLWRKSIGEESIFTSKKVELTSAKPVDVLMEKQKIIKTPLEISVAPKKLKIIIGKKREF